MQVVRDWAPESSRAEATDVPMTIDIASPSPAPSKVAGGSKSSAKVAPASPRTAAAMTAATAATAAAAAASPRPHGTGVNTGTKMSITAEAILDRFNKVQEQTRPDISSVLKPLPELPGLHDDLSFFRR